MTLPTVNTFLIMSDITLCKRSVTLPGQCCHVYCKPGTAVLPNPVSVSLFKQYSAVTLSHTAALLWFLDQKSASLLLFAHLQLLFIIHLFV